MIRKASSTARIVASHSSKSPASTCSPSAPMAREVSVTPSCIAAMKCGGSLVILTTERAVRLPSSASSLIRVRRTVTSEYSPATKKPFSRISSPTADQLEHDGHVRHARRAVAAGTAGERINRAPSGAQVLGGSSSSTTPSKYRQRPCRPRSAAPLPRARAARGGRASPRRRTGGPRASGRRRTAGRRPRTRSAARCRARPPWPRAAPGGGRSARVPARRDRRSARRARAARGSPSRAIVASSAPR